MYICMQNTYWRNNKDERHFKKYTSHFIWKVWKGLLKVLLWEGVGDWTKTATYWPPQSLRTSPCVVLVLLGCSTGGLGAQPLWDMFSFQHLLTNWSPNSLGGPEGPFCWVGAFSTTSCLQLIWSPTQSGVPKGPFCRVVAFSTTSFLEVLWSPTNWFPVSTELYNSSIAHSIFLEWHVWLSSSGNNCHAVHRSLSSSASVYECTVEFWPCLTPSAKRAHYNGICTSRSLECNVWRGRRSIYNS